MALALRDLPAGFAQSYSRPVSKAQLIKEQGFANPGFVSGWEAQFAKPGINSAIILSTVSRYVQPAQAHASLLASFKRAGTLPAMKQVSLGGSLGQDSRGFTYDSQVGGVTMNAYALTWRYRNLKGAVIFGGLASLSESAEQVAKTLAVRQFARMKRYA